MPTAVRQSASTWDKRDAIDRRCCKAAYLAVKRRVSQHLVSSQELALCLQQAGLNPTKDQVATAWPQPKGHLTFDDFCCIAQNQTRVDLREAFRKIDRNGDGYLSLDELTRLLRKVVKATQQIRMVGLQRGDCLSAAEIREVFKEADLNGDGRIDYEEFVQMVDKTSEETLNSNLRRLDDLESPPVENDHAEKNGPTSLPAKKRVFSRASPESTSELSGRSPPQPSTERSPPSRRSELNSASSRTSAAAAAAAAALSTPPAPASPSPTGRRGRTRRRQSQPVVKMVAPQSMHSKQPSSHKNATHTRRKGCFLYDEAENGSVVIVGNTYRLTVRRAGEIGFSIQSLSNCDQVAGEKETASPDLALFLLDNSSGQIVALTDNCDAAGCFHGNTSLKAGDYSLMPFTSGCRFKPRDQTEKAPVKLVEVRENGNVKLTKQFRMVLMNIFDLFDLDDSGSLNREEFNLYNIRTGDEVVTDEEWAVVKSNFDSKLGELTMRGFIELHELEAREAGADLDDMWVSLHQAGYNNSLVMDEALPFVVEVHADDDGTAVFVEAIKPLHSEPLWRAVTAYCWEEGDPLRAVDNSPSLRFWSTPFWGAVVCANETNATIRCSVDARACQNVDATLQHSPTAVEIRRGDTQVISFFAPTNPAEEWNINLHCSATV